MTQNAMKEKIMCGYGSVGMHDYTGVCPDISHVALFLRNCKDFFTSVKNQIIILSI